MLRQDGELDGLADLHVTRGRLERALDDVQERRLARPVLAQDAEPVSRADVPRDVVDDRLVAEALGHVDEVDDLLAQTRDRRPLQLEGVAHRRFVGDERARRVDAELRLGRSGASAAREPRELLAHDVLALLLGRLGGLRAFDALEHVGRVPALELLHLPVVHLPHAEADLVEEPAVVRDDEERARLLRPAALEVVGQPRDGVDVEMVGGLVEHEHVAVPDEHAGEIHATPLPAGELADPAVPGDVRDEAADDAADPGVRRPRVLGHVADDRVGDGRLRIERVGLLERADGGPAAPHDAAVVGLDRAREQREQRRLAVAVAADDADAVALVDAERDRVEDLLRRVLQMDVLASEQIRHSTNLDPHASRRARTTLSHCMSTQDTCRGTAMRATSCSRSERVRFARETSEPARG